MLKHLVILAVLVAALPPMPGQTVKPATQSTDSAKSQGQGNHAAADPSPSQIKKPEQSRSEEKHSGGVADEDKEHSVKLTRLPPVTLTEKTKGFWDHVLDWGPWVSNFLLVVVGGFQVWLLWKTWQKIGKQAEVMEGQLAEMKTQAGHMGEQTKILGESVEVAQASADAANAQIQAMKAKERARIAVEIQPLESLNFGIFNLVDIKVRIENLGLTHAFNVRTKGSAVGTTGTATPRLNEFYELISPTVIRSDSPLVECSILMSFDEDLFQDSIPQKVHIRIDVAGIVEYDDVFGGRHSTAFNHFKNIFELRQTAETNVYLIYQSSGWFNLDSSE